MPRLWYVRKNGRVHGPFPLGAVIQDRLVGRIAADDELSFDREEWRTVESWPELSSALAAAPPEAVSDEPQWSRERAKARLRWADERSGADRRTLEDVLVAGDRRSSGPERRALEQADSGKRSLERNRSRFGNERAMLKILAILAIAAGIVALLAWLYGPVNPVPVRIR